MPIFEERENALERKFERDREFAFKVTARRNKLLGLWAASHMGLTSESAARYALDVVEVAVLRHGDDAIVGRICADLVASGFPITPAEVRRKLKSLDETARKELA